MAYKVTIGHLVCDEYGTSGSAKSKPGDQTGKESRLQDWYKGNWEYVFRPKSTAVAKVIANAMKTICTMPNLGGYNQTRRTTLAKYAKDHNWDLNKVTEECESDCSASVAVCLNVAGIKVSTDMYTGNEKAVIEATKKFKTYTASKFLNKNDNLIKGDILLKKGHTAIVISKQYIMTRELKSGDSGTDVKKLQKCLNKKHIKINVDIINVNVDGVYGAETENAVKLFQKKKKLKVDGIVGVKTAKALGFAWKE